MIDRTQQVYYQGVFGLRLTFGLASSLTDALQQQQLSESVKLFVFRVNSGET